MTSFNDMLAMGAGFLADWQQRFVSSHVSYSRGGVVLATIPAMRGATAHPEVGLDSGNMAHLSFQEMDFVVKASDMADAGIGDPVQGDEISDGASTWRVLPIEGKHCHWMTAHGYQMVIHTKRVER